MKPILGIDMDDVLLDFMAPLCDFYNRVHGGSMTRDQLHVFDPSVNFKCSNEEALKLLFDFYDSPENAACMPVDGALDAITVLKNKYQLIIVTARPKKVADMTHAWVTKYFPGVFSDIIFTGLLGTEEKKKSKGEIAKELGFAGFVDDALHNAQSLSEHGIPVYLLNAPWNQGELPPLVTRYNTWKEITEAL